MNSKFIRHLIIISLLFFTNELMAQFVISSEIKPRLEYRDGYKQLNTMNDAPAFFVSQRTRLNLGFTQDRYKIYLSLQDVRTWGNQRQLVANEANAFSVNQAWGEIFFTKSKNLSLKLGRQAIALDDQRIFGAVNWAQQARSHDALILRYSNPKILNVNLGLAYNQNFGALTNTSYSIPGSYKTFQYLWLNKKFVNSKFQVSILFLNKGDEVKNDTNLNGVIEKGEYWDNYSQTIGTHLKFNHGKMGARANFYYQMGKVAEYNGPNMKPRSIGSMNASIDLNYKILDKLILFAGYEYLSGQSQTDTTISYNETNHSFAPFFGTNHKFNGFMDYFYVGNHANNVGLQDIYFKIKYKHSKFSLGADYHAFLAGAAVRDLNPLNTDPTKEMDRFLGSEIDLYAGIPITKDVKFNINYSIMLGTESMEAIKGGDRKQFNNYAYCELIFKPTIFDSKKFMQKKIKRKIEIVEEKTKN